MPNIAPITPSDIASDPGVLTISSSLMWALQPNTATNIYRAGRWPRLDGDIYSNQPSFPLPTSHAVDS